MPIRVASVNASRQLQAVVLAVRLLDKDVKREINKATRDEMNPVWKSLVELEAQSPGTHAVLVPGTRIAAGNPPSAKAATSTRKLSGGARPVDLAHLYEFGVGDPEKFGKPYQRKNRKSGGTHTVTRRTMRQLPRRVKGGRVVYPAFAELAPRMAKLWTQLVVKKTHEAFEKGSQ
jgi:hypothetical protein